MGRMELLTFFVFLLLIARISCVERTCDDAKHPILILPGTLHARNPSTFLDFASTILLHHKGEKVQYTLAGSLARWQYIKRKLGAAVQVMGRQIRTFQRAFLYFTMCLLSTSTSGSFIQPFCRPHGRAAASSSSSSSSGRSNADGRGGYINRGGNTAEAEATAAA